MMRYTQAVTLNKNGSLIKESGTEFWRIADEFIWYVDYDDKQGVSFIVPKGFITDFGSIPRGFRNIFNPTMYISYILHDLLYSGRVTRKEADRILREGLKVEGMNLIKRWIVYITLRIFGFLRYNK